MQVVLNITFAYPGLPNTCMESPRVDKSTQATMCGQLYPERVPAQLDAWLFLISAMQWEEFSLSTESPCPTALAFLLLNH